ncbi:MAG: hypothetical protein SOZ32_00145 [Bacilli bacterium]|nr:hypothetical protein [Mollicutes bacterium]MDY3898615.1 hypothetical protein [Bacilli bacterium]
MNIATNIIFLVITATFMGVYAYNLVLNLVRAIKTNKLLKADPQKIEATVVEVKQVKKRVYVRVQYKSESNLQTFESIYELTQKEFNDQYYEGQKLNIVYPKITGNKRIHCFPTYLEGTKLSIESGPLFTDCLILASGIFIFTFSLWKMLANDVFNKKLPLISTDGSPSTLTWLSVLIFLVIYFVLMTYLLERIGGISKDHSENYLKICGLKAKAEVITYKLGRTKNANGVRQSEIKIEFRTNKGEKVNAQIVSFMYTEHPDQFIDILYDGRRPQMAVYVRN